VITAGTAGSVPTDSAPSPDDIARAVFGSQLSSAERYAQLLAGDGVAHGLLGPRERDRLWDRHLVNCAVSAELLPMDARVVDVGSGAGLPGLALAIARTDLSVDLVEPMQRRTIFLDECVQVLGLADRVRVVRGRAESADVIRSVGGSEWACARAVAPLDRLASWCLPLLRVGGRLLALKGERAAGEVKEYASVIDELGGVVDDVVRCGERFTSEPTTVIVVRRLR
jgi:16S rRNA (guanine527-N7)-methyltransferase